LYQIFKNLRQPEMNHKTNVRISSDFVKEKIEYSVPLTYEPNSFPRAGRNSSWS